MPPSSGPAFRRSVAEATTRTFPRARLYGRLDAACRAAVTLVIADEGFGKSTLIRDYLAVRDIPHLRFDAGPQHAAPGELLRGLAAAFRGICPATERSVGPAAMALELSDDRPAALAWAREHLAGIAGTVLLDELHHVAAEPRCTSFLAALIEDAPPAVRWIVVLRDGAAFPVPRWLASGLSDLPIETVDLRVQPDELVAAYERRGIAIAPYDAASLYECNAGWPLGLSLALASGRTDARSTRDDVYDGLVDAAFERCSHLERDHLYETAAVGRFDDRVLAALECDPGLGEFLASTQLAYVVHDTSHAYYEPCRTRIRERLERLEPAHRATILDRAAAALERVGRWSESIALRVHAGDEGRIAAALTSRGFPALDHGEVSTVAQGLAAVGERTLEHYPVALGMKAALASLDESFDVSEAWFTMAIETARGRERREIVIRYGMDLVRRGRPDVVTLLEAESARDETGAGADADAALWALLGTAYVESHRRDDAREAARRALARLPGVRDDGVRARVLHQASYVALNDSDWSAAKTLAERALSRAEEAFLYDLAARALSVLFNVAMLHEDDVPAARSALVRLEDAGRKAGSHALRLYAILNAYAIEVDAGDVVALARLNAKLGDMHVLLTPMVGEALLPAQALRAAWDGRFAHAHDLLATGAEKLFDDDRIAYRWAEVAVYAAAAARPAEAIAGIAHCRATLARIPGEPPPLAVRALAYLALAHTLTEDGDAARATIAAARASAHATSPRINALVESVAAFHDCGADSARAFLRLGEMLDDLERCELGGVARLIGRLPVATERRPAAAVDRAGALHDMVAKTVAAV